MRQHEGHSCAKPDAPRPVRSWRLLLLVLLVLLPVKVALAAPGPMHPVGDSPTNSNVHAHDPLETPVCHHEGHQHTASGLLADKRGLDTPPSGEGPDTGFAAIPSRGPATDFIPGVAPAALDRLSVHADHTLPLYLLTQRFRA